MAAYNTNAAPTAAGGVLTVDGSGIGFYDYRIAGPTTLSSFTAADWFTATENFLAFVAIRGDLTINAGVTMRPTIGKRVICIYAQGNIVINGTISATGRAARAPSPVPARVLLRNNVTSYTCDGNASVYGQPQSHAIVLENIAQTTAGASVANGFNGYQSAPNATSETYPSLVDLGGGSFRAILSGGRGGGGAIGTQSAATSAQSAGQGQIGSLFGGGSGGGAARFYTSGGWSDGVNAVVYGGAGGAFGANGNPAATGFNSGDNTLEQGVGGVIVLFAGGTISGSGSVEARGLGTNVPTNGVELISGVSGGATGGGIIAMFSRVSRTSITANTTGGTSIGTNAKGGNGGNGAVARILV